MRKKSKSRAAKLINRTGGGDFLCFLSGRVNRDCDSCASSSSAYYYYFLFEKYIYRESHREGAGGSHSASRTQTLNKYRQKYEPNLNSAGVCLAHNTERIITTLIINQSNNHIHPYMYAICM
jgi:hypothetical protein